MVVGRGAYALMRFGTVIAVAGGALLWLGYVGIGDRHFAPSTARAAVLLALGGLITTGGGVFAVADSAFRTQLGPIQIVASTMLPSLVPAAIFWWLGTSLIAWTWLRRQSSMDVLLQTWSCVGISGVVLFTFGTSLHLTWDAPRFGYWVSDKWNIDRFHTYGASMPAVTGSLIAAQLGLYLAIAGAVGGLLWLRLVERNEGRLVVRVGWSMLLSHLSWARCWGIELRKRFERS